MKPKYFVSISPKKKIYFNTYAEAQDYVEHFRPVGKTNGRYHIYPVDKSGYTSKPEGRTSFGEGNKDWGKK